MKFKQFYFDVTSEYFQKVIFTITTRIFEAVYFISTKLYNGSVGLALYMVPSDQGTAHTP